MRILFTWEIGQRTGHLNTIKSFIDWALKSNHEVYLAAKELNNIYKFFPFGSINLIQSPQLTRGPKREIAISWNELMLLRYSDTEELLAIMDTWNVIFDQVKPDLVVFEASPSALFASIGKNFKKWTLGTPLFMPRHDINFFGQYPDPRLQDIEKFTQRLIISEKKLLVNINKCLNRLSKPLVQNSHEIFKQCDREILPYPPQFDYFYPRINGDFIGCAPVPSYSSNVNWPKHYKYKIFCYLQPFKSIKKFLSRMQEDGLNSVVYCPEFTKNDKEQLSKHSFLDNAVNMNSLLKEADLVIHMGGIQTATKALYHEIPQVIIVKGREQEFTARSSVSLGPTLMVKTFCSDEYLNKIITHIPKLINQRKFKKGLEKKYIDGSLAIKKSKLYIENI